MIINASIFFGFLLGGYLIVRKISLEKLGRKGIVLLPLLLLGSASLVEYGINILQNESDIKSSTSWRDIDPITRAKATLPSGFKIETVIPDQELSFPTSIAQGDNGEVYISTAQGILIVDQELQRVREFAPDITQVLGSDFKDGSLYVSTKGSVIKLTDTNGNGKADNSEEIISGLPHQVYTNHTNNGITFGPDGLLYMTLGSTSDHGPEESDIAGSVLVANRDGTELSVYARGFRNPFDLTFCPDGNLFVTDNGPDLLDFEGNNKLVYRPPDELNLVQKGKDYGYPEFFGHSPPWTETESPIAIFPMSAAVTGVACYDGESFPKEYKGNLFVTQWGSMVIPEETGHKLVRVELEKKGDYILGTVHDFADLWRPIDVIVYTDGSLLVLDLEAFKMYRISYTQLN